MNPLGIGIDLLYVPRIKSFLERYGERFLKRVFTEEEINYALKKREPSYALASSFAVKEAFYKALGGYPGFRFRELSLVRTEKGSPQLKLSGKAKEIFYERGGEKITLSISHDFHYTIAIVMLWGKGEER